MKTYKPTMSHNVCDENSRRWLVNIFDVVEIDDTLCGEGVYFGYVSKLTLHFIEVVRLKDRKVFNFNSHSANNYLSVTRRCSLIFVLPSDSFAGVQVFSVGQSVVDRSFDGKFEWHISKFDNSNNRAFVCRVISGRNIGHWVDVRDLVDFTSFKE